MMEKCQMMQVMQIIQLKLSVKNVIKLVYQGYNQN